MTDEQPDTITSGNGWQSRKLWFCVLLVTLATALLWFSRVGEETWLAVATASVWAYVAGNVGSAAAESLAKILAAISVKK